MVNREHTSCRLAGISPATGTTVQHFESDEHHGLPHPGGDDKCCRVTAHLLPSEAVVVEDIDKDFFAAIDRATEREGECSPGK